MAGDFILFLDSKLDTEDENPTMKKKSLNKFFKLKESYLIPGELKKNKKNPRHLNGLLLRKNILQF